MERILNDFLEWVKEPIHEDFRVYVPLGNRILVRLYFFDAKKDVPNVKIYKDLDSDATLQQEMNSRLFSIGKVLAIGKVSSDYKELQPGDLVTVSDDVTGSYENMKWLEYQMMLKEKPSMAEKVPEPSRYLSNIVKWKEYVFIRDKFGTEATIHDAYTFLLPERYILTKYEQA